MAIFRRKTAKKQQRANKRNTRRQRGGEGDPDRSSELQEVLRRDVAVAAKVKRVGSGDTAKYIAFRPTSKGGFVPRKPGTEIPLDVDEMFENLFDILVGIAADTDSIDVVVREINDKHPVDLIKNKYIEQGDINLGGQSYTVYLMLNKPPAALPAGAPAPPDILLNPFHAFNTNELLKELREICRSSGGVKFHINRFIHENRDFIQANLLNVSNKDLVDTMYERIREHLLGGAAAVADSVVVTAKQKLNSLKSNFNWLLTTQAGRVEFAKLSLVLIGGLVNGTLATAASASLFLTTYTASSIAHTALWASSATLSAIMQSVGLTLGGYGFYIYLLFFSPIYISYGVFILVWGLKRRYPGLTVENLKDTLIETCRIIGLTDEVNRYLETIAGVKEQAWDTAIMAVDTGKDFATFSNDLATGAVKPGIAVFDGLTKIFQLARRQLASLSEAERQRKIGALNQYLQTGLTHLGAPADQQPVPDGGINDDNSDRIKEVLEKFTDPDIRPEELTERHQEDVLNDEKALRRLEAEIRKDLAAVDEPEQTESERLTGSIPDDTGVPGEVIVLRREDGGGAAPGGAGGGRRKRRRNTRNKRKKNRGSNRKRTKNNRKKNKSR